jgi:hypothetical protein
LNDDLEILGVDNSQLLPSKLFKITDTVIVVGADVSAPESI